MMFLILFIIFGCSGVVLSKENSVNLLMNNTATPEHSEIYGEFHMLNKFETKVFLVKNLPTNISFIIFQVHSHIQNVYLYQDDMISGNFVNGTNVGLYQDINTLKEKPFYIFNPINLDILVYISVHGYGSKAPIPGGCNMELPIPVSPYINVKYTKDIITVETSPAKILNTLTCDKLIANVTYEYFRLYLGEWDLSQLSYFKAIRMMLNYDDMVKYANHVPEHTGYAQLRRTFSSYPGTGSIYAVAVTTPLGRSVYVPSHSYACNLSDLDTCAPVDDQFSLIGISLLMFVGVFMTYFGHSFFKTEMFLIGMVVGCLFTYIFISVMVTLDNGSLTTVTLVSGVCFGAIWFVFWWYCGLPLFSVLLVTLVLGFLAAAVVFYAIPGGIPLLESNLSIWTVLLCILIVVQIICLMTLHANILACAILGSYTVICALDTVSGAYLRYIIINIVRLATVDEFSKAVISPPFQWRDILLTLLWIVLAVTGFLFQKNRNNGRPPFPPPPRGTMPSVRARRIPNERSPLLTQTMYSNMPINAPSYGYISVNPNPANTYIPANYPISPANNGYPQSTVPVSNTLIPVNPDNLTPNRSTTGYNPEVHGYNTYPILPSCPEELQAPPRYGAIPK